jgi:prepilin-type N-terminal cleavage/methylation domain-containing protein
MRPARTGFTLIELLVVIVVGAVLTSIAGARLSRYFAEQGARNARDEFVYLASRARMAAIERSRVVRLELEPASGRAWVIATSGGVEDTLEVRHFMAEHQAEVETAGGGPLRVCYSPRGYALDLCTDVKKNTEVKFTRGSRSAPVIVRPLGQVVRP